LGDAVLEEEEALGKAYDARLLRHLWPYIAPFRGQVALTLAMALPIFAFELAPAWIIRVGLDGLLPNQPGAARFEPSGAIQAVDRFLAPVLEGQSIGWLATLLLLALIIGAALRFAHLILMARTGQLAMRKLRNDVFAHIQSLHLSFFDRHPVGRLVTRASNDTENIAEMFSAGIVAAVIDLFFMVGYAAVLWSIDSHLATRVFLVVPILAFCALVFRLRIRQAFRKVRVRIARINAVVQETVTGMKVVQLFRREERNLHDFDKLNASHRDAWVESIRYDAALFSVVEVAGGLSVAIIIGYGWGLATAGVLYLFIDYMRRFFLPLRDLSAKYSVMQSAMASCERVFALMETEPAIRDHARGPEGTARREPQAGEVQTKTPPPLGTSRGGQGEVIFENVWFAYRDGDWILRDISFRVVPGERVAFVGATGAGKTTIIKLLARFYDVDRGRILLDGVDLREMRQRDLRRRVAMVLQDVFLFSGTVADNIGLERRDIGRERIEWAAGAVQADRFIRAMPKGYDTVLRERGSNLSAGQRQLLSFARALAHGSDVLVLDEATSSVDTETELMVQRGLRTLMDGQTALVIAHRLSTIQDADRIYVLHRGEVVEVGTHDELMEARGAYSRLYRLQFDGQRAKSA
jgi:ATP-binding cassette subfamily B protein